MCNLMILQHNYRKKRAWSNVRVLCTKYSMNKGAKVIDLGLENLLNLSFKC